MMTLAINIPITEQDIKHVQVAPCKLYRVSFNICEVLCKSFTVTDRCTVYLRQSTLKFKTQLFGQNDQIIIIDYFFLPQEPQVGKLKVLDPFYS